MKRSDRKVLRQDDLHRQVASRSGLPASTVRVIAGALWDEIMQQFMCDGKNAVSIPPLGSLQLVSTGKGTHRVRFRPSPSLKRKLKSMPSPGAD